MEPMLATQPMHIVHIDFLTIESGKKDKDHNVLVVTNQSLDLHKHLSLLPKLAKPLPRPCGINTLCIMGFQK